MSDFVAVDITGIETLNQRLKKLPDEARNQGVETADEHIVNLMRTYPPHSSEPFQWSSDKQRRFVMAKLRESGQTFYTRTQTLSQGWKTVGSGYKQIVANEVDYVQYVQGNGQIQGHKARGWNTIMQVIKANEKRILQKFEEGVRKAIRKLGLA